MIEQKAAPGLFRQSSELPPDQGLQLGVFIDLSMNSVEFTLLIQR
jgi:hypothetical protein